MKKHIPFITLFLSVSTTVFSQEWHTDFGKAREIAASQKKDIILVFQGSDWCAPCIRLEREILATVAF
ncbi:MAG: thioredoxin family protein, partial [Eudoraea sp.]|nr:thioredoxin family protein [Eudoraea sp.]